MKKVYYIYWAFILFIIVSFSACKKFLDLKPISAITTDNAYTTSANIEAALNGAYSSFIGTNYYQWNI